MRLRARHWLVIGAIALVAVVALVLIAFLEGDIPDIDLAVAATDNLKRVVGLSASTDWAATPTLERMLTYLETKTVWHPASM